jgi:hypothetical protein
LRCASGQQLCACANGAYCLAGNALCITPQSPCPGGTSSIACGSTEHVCACRVGASCAFLGATCPASDMPCP